MLGFSSKLYFTSVLLAGGGKQFRHLSAHIIGVGGDNRRGGGRWVSFTSFTRSPSSVSRSTSGASSLSASSFAAGSYPPVFQRFIRFADRLEGFTLKFIEVIHPLIDTIGAAALQCLSYGTVRVRAVFRSRIAVSR